jgi:3-deoxy-manno-octulosonate cytidylyltransferase (CMP-KDO synthetase)
MKTLIIIPARQASTRFPGKPLHLIGGVSMLARTIEVARRAGAARRARVIVATDDEAIAAHARAHGCESVMTHSDLPSGTDRARAAMLALEPEADFVVNLQGDAPFTPPDHVAALIDNAGAGDVVTPVVRLTWSALDDLRQRKATTPFSGTTCIRAPDGRALWFSKSILPAMRAEARLRAAGPLSPVFQHIGLYGYSRDALARIAAWPPSHYEQIEGLEQLRFLENGLRVHAVEVAAAELSISGIDTPHDAQLAEDLLVKYGDPHRLAPDAP